MVLAYGSQADGVPQAKPRTAGRDILGQQIGQPIQPGHMLFAACEDYAAYS